MEKSPGEAAEDVMSTARILLLVSAAAVVLAWVGYVTLSMLYEPPPRPFDLPTIAFEYTLVLPAVIAALVGERRRLPGEKSWMVLGTLSAVFGMTRGAPRLYYHVRYAIQHPRAIDRVVLGNPLADLLLVSGFLTIAAILAGSLVLAFRNRDQLE
jgi:hypothetical protein